MTAEQFVYWLQGFMEIYDPKVIHGPQTQIIKDHLALVFDKQTPNRTIILAEEKETLPFNGTKVCTSSKVLC